MRQIEFASLHEALLAIKSWQGFRVLYVQNAAITNVPDLFSYGPNGVITIKESLFSFYNSCLQTISTFDQIFASLATEFSSFDNEYLARQKIPAAKYKEVILRICDKLDELEKHGRYPILS